MQSTTAVCIAAAWLCLTVECASARSCTDSGNALLSAYSAAKADLEREGCSELDRFLSARKRYAEFIDGALANGCPEDYAALNRLLISEAYKRAPENCGSAWRSKDNRQRQHDAIAILNRDLSSGVYIVGDAVIVRHTFWHAGNHVVGLAIDKCERAGADTAFAMQCSAGKEPTVSSVFTFDATQLGTDIDVAKKSALAVRTGDRAQTPEELIKSLTTRGTTSDASSVILRCLPDTLCVGSKTAGVKMNEISLFCDPEVNCDDVLSHVVDVLAMMLKKG